MIFKGNVGEADEVNWIALKVKVRLLQQNDKAEKIRLIIIAVLSFILMTSLFYNYGENTSKKEQVHLIKSVVLQSVNTRNWGDNVGIELLVSGKFGLNRYYLPNTQATSPQVFAPYLGKTIEITVDYSKRLWAMKYENEEIVPKHFFQQLNREYQGVQSGIFITVIIDIIELLLLYTIVDYLWLRFYRRGLIQRGEVVDISKKRAAFAARKGTTLFVVGILLIAFISVVKLCLLGNAMLLMFGLFALIFGLMFFYSLKALFVRGPAVVITDEYFSCRLWSMPWANIKGLSLRVVNRPDNQSYMNLDFEVKDKKYLTNYSEYFKKLGSSNFAKKGSLSFPISALEVDGKDFLVILKRFTNLEVKNEKMLLFSSTGVLEAISK